MIFIEWSAEETIDVQDIDKQHSEMANILNILHTTLGTDQYDKAKMYCKELVITLREHLDTEENYMKDNKYPNFISHKLEHDRFMKKVEDFCRKVETGNETVNLEFLNSAKKWLFNHLAINDKKLGAFLISKGIVEPASNKKVNA